MYGMDDNMNIYKMTSYKRFCFAACTVATLGVANFAYEYTAKPVSPKIVVNPRLEAIIDEEELYKPVPRTINKAFKRYNPKNDYNFGSRKISAKPLGYASKSYNRPYKNKR